MLGFAGGAFGRKTMLPPAGAAGDTGGSAAADANCTDAFGVPTGVEKVESTTEVACACGRGFDINAEWG